MILIIDQNPKNSQGLSDMFAYMGILSYATSPKEALYETLSHFSAIIFSDADKIDDVNTVFKIQNFYSNAAIFGISSLIKNDFPFDLTFKKGTYASEIFTHITDYAKRNGLKAPGIYKTNKIDASANLSYPIYEGKTVKLTRTENFILKALILSSPDPIGANDLLKYLFKPSKIPDISNIRTHISIINKKFREQIGKNLIFHSRLGYYFFSEEFSEEKVLQPI